MLKHLGTFAILAVCLFAIAMVMGGCEKTQQMVAPIVTDNGSGDTMLPPVGESTPPEGMVLIPAGSFQMGSDDDEAEDDEQPVHTVHLDAFYMDVYEVTNAQFKAFVDANPQWQKDNLENRFHYSIYLYHWSGPDYPAGKANHPVVHVGWYAAMAYAEWAGKRLPTEAEWEYAARGGLAGKKYPWGDTITFADANYADSGIGDTTPVGQYAANGYGLYDMAGNVWEWCLNASETLNSRNPFNFSHVLRSGSWITSAQFLRVTDRFWRPPTDGNSDRGFRCVRPVTP